LAAVTNSRGAVVAAAAGLAAAAVVQKHASEAERSHRLRGRFAYVDGTAVHYLERGEGPALVMLHGLDLMIDDLVLSGLVSRASEHYRVVAIDLPGHGRTPRPRDRAWTPMAQAALLHRTLRTLNVSSPILLGHSFGATVALAYALRHAVERLVLVSGYYYPSLRLDVPLLLPPAIPVLGSVMRHTVSPLLGRLLWPAWIRLLFSPRAVPRRFRAFPTWLALRPSQLRAVGEDAALVLPAVRAMAPSYPKLRAPTTLIAGAADRYVSPNQSRWLHEDVPGSELVLVPGAGHMAHYAASESIVDSLASRRPTDLQLAG
jgi:pimeloyl-ACP methyl ester carboxylesterase